ncbi:MAG: type II toxin-antitoxin system HicA family toxin [Minisyncoccia bacterium]
MSKLPVIRHRQLIKVLKGLGFLEHPERGSSHLIFKHSDGRMTTVARHTGDFPRGTLRGILHDIGISPEEFVRLLKK